MTEPGRGKVSRRRKIMLIYPRQGFAYTKSCQYPLETIHHFLLGAREAGGILKRLSKQDRRGLRIVGIDI